MEATPVPQVELKSKVIEIGDWDMDSDLTNTIEHLLGKVIRSVTVIIRKDDDITYYDLLSKDANAFTSLNESYINLARSPGGFFDSTDFDSTSFNRGWVTIFYVDS